MNQKKQQEFSKFFLLYKLEGEYPINVLLEEDDKYLEPILENISSQGYIEIDVGYYQITALGKQVYSQMMKRYVDFILNFDIYCAVDLNNGKFAFEKYWEIEELEWKTYLSLDRFEDLRIAVALYKKIDPAEIVFLSFINEGRFDQITKKSGWQFDLASGEIWKEINEILKNAITIENLAYQENNVTISGEIVLADIINSGAQINLSLWENEGKYFREEYELEMDKDSLKSYLNKDYVNPIWKKNIF